MKTYAPDAASPRQDMTAFLAAEDAIFVLQGHDVDVVHVQEIGGSPIGSGLALRDLEADT
ncbi:hypothetical protein [Pendulispora albinea]|uniref:Uncharacterized protein n=1 Tax=Pendulispora albinea TaxID=2741071 RepID=A0ABZ2LWT8_9BACT